MGDVLNCGFFSLAYAMHLTNHTEIDSQVQLFMLICGMMLICLVVPTGQPLSTSFEIRNRQLWP